MALRGLQAVGSSDAKLLLAHVGVSDTPSPYKGEEYQGEGGGGEEEEEEKDPNAWRDNQDLAARFSVPFVEDDEGENKGMPHAPNPSPTPSPTLSFAPLGSSLITPGSSLTMPSLTPGMPKFFYFAADWKDGTAPVAYEGEPTKDGLLRFAQDRAGVWVGLPGQVKALHVLAQGFGAASADGRTKALAAAQAGSKCVSRQ